MPLLHVVGTSSTNMSFSAGFCFMKGETVEDYIWAMREVKECFENGQLPSAMITDRERALMAAISLVFPNANNLLCQWHINQNIVAKAKEHIRTADEHKGFCQDWGDLVSSSDRLAFDESWQRFQAKYESTSELLTYLRQTWIQYREKFVLAWTKEVMHFGHLVTSRVEGAHAVLKSWLEVSNGDLNRVCTKLRMCVEHQVRSVRHQISVDGSSKVISLTHPIWSNVNGLISHFALKKTSDQLEKAKRLRATEPPCTDFIWSTMGLPCAHTLRTLLDSNRPLLKENFHQHWWVVKEPVRLPSLDQTPASFSDVLRRIETRLHEAPPHQRPSMLQRLETALETEVVRDPEVVRTRGRPGRVSGQATSSTRREPSSFEISGNSSDQRKCGRCNKHGHNRRTCPEPNV